MSTTPVFVIGGYLGAGKTTLVNRWLREARDLGIRLAVLVNDFGEIGIDAELIVSEGTEVIELAGGCVCCSFGNDLVGAVARLRAREPAPDCLLIETSGVALPGTVARTARLAPEVALAPVLVLADATGVIEKSQDRYVGDTVLRQLAQADRVLLSRTELVDPGRLAQLREWLQEVAPRASVGSSATEGCPEPTQAGTPAKLPSPPVRRRTGRRARPVPRAFTSFGATDARRLFESHSAAFDGPVDIHALAAALLDPSLGLERAKGIVGDDQGQLWAIQLAGGRLSLTVHESLAAGAGIDRLVCIGLRQRIDRGAVRRLIERFGGRPLGKSPD